MAASKVAARSGLPPSHLAHPSLHPLWQKGITGCRLFLVRSCYLGPKRYTLCRSSSLSDFTTSSLTPDDQIWPLG